MILFHWRNHGCMLIIDQDLNNALSTYVIYRLAVEIKGLK